MGLKDQVMVFRWVQENISSFGGDPNNVTLTGCSAASCDVHFHLMSPLSKGSINVSFSLDGLTKVKGIYNEMSFLQDYFIG